MGTYLVRAYMCDLCGTEGIDRTDHNQPFMFGDAAVCHRCASIVHKVHHGKPAIGDDIVAAYDEWLDSHFSKG